MDFQHQKSRFLSSRFLQSFEEQKKRQLSKSDKSSIGSWDKKIKDLCEKINEKKNYYTTSSCGGRIVLLKASSKKIRDVFLFRSHETISFSELKKVLKKVEYSGLVEFQQTSCILHVACENMKDALELVRKAKFAGWKRSGVMSGGKRFMVELHSTESISFPIMNKSKILVSDDFLGLVLRQANQKLKRTWEKINKLEGVI